MKIVIVIQKIAGLRGGAERIVVDLAGGLKCRGHEVTVVTFEPSTELPGYPLDGIDVVNLFPPILRRVLALLSQPGSLDPVEQRVSRRRWGRIGDWALWHMTHGVFARRLTRWLKHQCVDVVVGFMPPAISAVAFGGIRLGDRRPRLVASTHNVPDHDFGDSARWDQNPVARERNRAALSMVDVVTVLQPDFIDQLPRSARGQATVMPNPVERRGGGDHPASRRPVILGVGRLTDVKRYDLAVHAAKVFLADHPEWRMEIFGEGPEQAALEALITGSGLADHVRLRGTTSDIGRHYDTARILIHPAKFEGFGLSVAEAILHGLPVVAFSSCSGVNALVEPGITGLLVDESPDPVGALAQALAHLADDPLSDASHQAGIDRLADRLDPDRILDRWEQILTGDLPAQ